MKIDGAAYDPASGTWRTLPPAPTPDGYSPRSLTPAGDRITVTFGRGFGCAVDDPAPDPAGAWYDAGSDTWSTIPPSPISLVCTPAGAWSGGKLWMFEGPQGAVYDPATGIWAAVAPPPAMDGFGVSTIHPLGNQLVALGTVPGGGPERLAPTLAAFDIASQAWSALPVPPLDVSGPSVVAGDRLFVFDPQRSAGASWDPATRSWTALPDAPIGTRIGSATVAVGDRLVVWGGVEAPRRVETPSAMLAVEPGPPLQDGAAYDPTTGTWSVLPDSPIAGRMDSAAIGTGDQLFAWGGQLIEPTDTGSRSVARADGAVLTPRASGNGVTSPTTSSQPTTTSSPTGVSPPSSAGPSVDPGATDTGGSRSGTDHDALGPCPSVTTTTLAGRPAPPDTSGSCLEVTTRTVALRAP